MPYYLTVDMREETGWGMPDLNADSLDEFEKILKDEGVTFERDGWVFTYWGDTRDDLVDAVQLQHDVLGDSPEPMTYEEADDYVSQLGGSMDEEDDEFTYSDFEDEDDWSERGNDLDDL